MPIRICNSKLSVKNNKLQLYDKNKCCRKCPAWQYWDGEKCVDNDLCPCLPVGGCPAGQHCNDNVKMCVPDCTAQVCNAGFHWDPLLCSCQPDCGAQPCHDGMYWNYEICQCLYICPDPCTCEAPLVWSFLACQCQCPDSITCEPGKHVDPATCECVWNCPDPGTCDPHEVWNYVTCQCDYCPDWEEDIWDIVEASGGSWDGWVFNHVAASNCGGPGGFSARKSRLFLVTETTQFTCKVEGETERQDAGYDFATVLIDNVVIAQISSTDENKGCEQLYHVDEKTVTLEPGCHRLTLTSNSNDSLYHYATGFTFTVTKG